MKGHWYCSACNDVSLNIAPPVGRYDLKDGVFCPDCRNHSARWVEDVAPPKVKMQKPDESRVRLSSERARQLFEVLKNQEEELPGGICDGCGKQVDWLKICNGYGVAGVCLCRDCLGQ